MSDGSVNKKPNMDVQDTTTATLLKYFTDASLVAEKKFMKNQILIANENRGARGPKEYLK